MLPLPRIGITLGDPAGIGPEILAKLITTEPLSELCVPVIVGDARVVRQALELIGAPESFERERIEVVAELPAAADAAKDPERVYLVDLANIGLDEFSHGEVSAAAGRAAGAFIERAIELALSGVLDAVVTNPINKQAFVLGGWGNSYAGHTEMFTDLTGAASTCMMLAAGPLRVCHVTTHVSLREALELIRLPRILEVIELAHATGRKLGIAAPQVGVAALNPHAGEGGVFGDEELTEIGPAIEEARRRGIDADGPVPADTLFSKARGGMYDLVLAMYHDQGHIPVKLAGFDYDHATGSWTMHGVNVTLGLPIIRTSVDHGTAFDRAGRGDADHRSLLEAVRYACRLTAG